MEHIKKISIKTVEEAIQAKLIPNRISIGFDVAQHATGIAIIRTTDKYLVLEKLHKIVVPKKIKELDAVDLFLEQLNSFKNEVSQKYKFDKTVIENCFLKFNVATLKALARFGILVYDRFRGLSKYTELKYPKSARSQVNFERSSKSVKGAKLKKEIITYVNKVLKIEIKDNDEADAIVLALSGLVKKEK